MVARGGKMLYHNAFGKANLELDADLTTDFVFQIGSMTKQFTAVAILMLEEQGKLRVDHPVSVFAGLPWRRLDYVTSSINTYFWH